MKRSVDRILTTHTGSLPRPPDLLEAVYAQEDGKAEPAAVEARIRDAVTEVVRWQFTSRYRTPPDGAIRRR